MEELKKIGIQLAIFFFGWLIKFFKRETVAAERETKKMVKNRTVKFFLNEAEVEVINNIRSKMLLSNDNIETEERLMYQSKIVYEDMVRQNFNEDSVVLIENAIDEIFALLKKSCDQANINLSVAEENFYKEYIKKSVEKVFEKRKSEMLEKYMILYSFSNDSKKTEKYETLKTKLYSEFKSECQTEYEDSSFGVFVETDTDELTFVIEGYGTPRNNSVLDEKVFASISDIVSGGYEGSKFFTMELNSSLANKTFFVEKSKLMKAELEFKKIIFDITKNQNNYTGLSTAINKMIRAIDKIGKDISVKRPIKFEIRVKSVEDSEEFRNTFHNNNQNVINGKRLDIQLDIRFDPKQN